MRGHKRSNGLTVLHRAIDVYFSLINTLQVGRYEFYAVFSSFVVLKRAISPESSHSTLPQGEAHLDFGLIGRRAALTSGPSIIGVSKGQGSAGATNSGKTLPIIETWKCGSIEGAADGE